MLSVSLPQFADKAVQLFNGIFGQRFRGGGSFSIWQQARHLGLQSVRNSNDHLKAELWLRYLVGERGLGDSALLREPLPGTRRKLGPYLLSHIAVKGASYDWTTFSGSRLIAHGWIRRGRTETPHG
jgi:hypothetical protein